MVINTANDLKAYFKKYGLRLIDIASILDMSYQTMSTKINNLSFTIRELQEIAKYTTEILIIGDMRGE